MVVFLCLHMIFEAPVASYHQVFFQMKIALMTTHASNDSLVAPVLINGSWITSKGTDFLSAIDPSTNTARAMRFPVSPWPEVETALTAAHAAWVTVRSWSGQRFAKFLNHYADLIEKAIPELAALANLETGLPITPRLKDGEVPRTINQLRLAAKSAESGTWRNPVIDTTNQLRSMLEPIGPILIFGPNNFPFAYNSISGGDFAAAVAAGNPVIAKAHHSHPEITLELAKLAHTASVATDMPPGFIQLLYHMDAEHGIEMVKHPAIAGVGYTGSRFAGLKIKAAADVSGKPSYLEMSSVNPVVILPGTLAERFDATVDEFCSSCLMAAGQFCTNPGFVLLFDQPESARFIKAVADKFAASTPGTMLSPGVRDNFEKQLSGLLSAGAEIVTGGKPLSETRIAFQNTLLKATGDQFLKSPEGLQGEAFGNGSIFILVKDEAQLLQILDQMEGNLTGCIYSAKNGADDVAYGPVAERLRKKVGRLLNDKMPTGVAVSPAMNHGGPYPATGHAVFSAVGVPVSLYRFSMLCSYDSVREARLPAILQNKNPHPDLFRCIDGIFTKDDILV
jgi:NADP-dependent aldehyde dehydrogenase